MLVEGRGIVAPSPIRCAVSMREINQLRAIAARRNAYRGYQSRRDQWGRGLTKDPIVVGLIGEHAVLSFLNSRLGTRMSVDDRLLRVGDGGVDALVNGYSMQIKTRQRGRQNLIRTLDDRKRLIAFNVEAFVFAKFAEPSDVFLLGWITADDARGVGDFKRSRVADHFNTVVEDKELEPMSRLIAEIQLRSVA